MGECISDTVIFISNNTMFEIKITVFKSNLLNDFNPSVARVVAKSYLKSGYYNPQKYEVNPSFYCFIEVLFSF